MRTVRSVNQLLVCVVLSTALATVVPGPHARASEPSEKAEWIPLRGSHGVTCTWGTEGAPDNVCYHDGDPYHGSHAIDIDTDNDRDEPVYAAGYGKVTAYDDSCGSCKKGFGNWVMTYHVDDDRTVLYAHLASVDPYVKAVDTRPVHITPDTKIGIEGNTGYSFGDHLHYAEYDGEHDSPSGLKPTLPGPMRGIVGDKDVQYPRDWGLDSWSEASWDPVRQTGTQYFLSNDGCGNRCPSELPTAPICGTSRSRWSVLGPTPIGELGSGGEGWGSGAYTTAVATGDVDGDGLDEVIIGRKSSVNGRWMIYDDATNNFATLKVGGEGWGSCESVTAAATGFVQASDSHGLVIGHSLLTDQRRSQPHARLRLAARAR